MALIRSDNSIPIPALLKRFALIYLPIVMVLSVALLTAIRLEEQIHVKEIEGREIAEVGNAQELVTRDLAVVDSDLRIFAKLPILRLYLDSGNPAYRDELEKLFLVLAQESRRYDQVRYLDASGQEVIRINYNGGKPAIVPREQLQNKKGRYYFDDTLKLNQGEIFVSPLDLNFEHGSLEIPYKPTIRFGTPVFDSAGRKKGIILFNYLGDNLLQHFRRPMQEDDSHDMLLNRDGYWLSGTKPEDEWGFMLGKSERTFEHDFPEAWRAISAAERGTLRTDQGLFAYATVYPLENLLGEQHSSTGSALANAPSQQNLAEHEYHWKIVSFVPHDVLSGAAFYNQTGNRIALVVAYLLFALGAWIVASVTLSRKRAEETLRESEARFHALVDVAGDLIFTVHANGEVIYVNEMAARALHTVPEQVVGKHLRDLFPPETFERLWRNLQKVFETGEPLYVEAPTCFPHGEVWLSTWLTPLCDVSGSIIAVLGASRDITERKRAEEKVKKNESRFRSYIQLTGQLAWNADAEGKAVEDIPEWRAFTGQSEAQVKGHGWSEAIHPNDRERVMQIWLEAVGRKGKYEAEIRVRRHDGVYRDFLDRGVPLFDESGQIREWVGTAIDITERKKAEEALRAAHEEVLKKSGRLEKFQQVAVDRELRMVEMKDEVNGLLERLGEPRKYVEVDSIKKR